MVEEGSQIFSEDYDLDLLLSAFASDPAPPTPPQPISDSDSPVSVTSDPIPDLDPTVIGDMERFLMSDEAEKQELEGEGKEMEFFDGLFVDDLAGNGTESDQPKSSDGDLAVVGNETESESDHAKSSDDGRAASMEKGEVDKERDSDNDPNNKKIKRQMRNRDSARSSRERKKQYIKELEMKSRYMESECKRLNYALQCFMSENMALRQSMLCKESGAGKKGKSGPHSGDVAMRESAVLLSESQQSGSLHCLVSIVWCLLLSLLLPPFPLLTTLPTSPRRGAVPTVPRQVQLVPKDPKREIDSAFGQDDLYLLRRRCKESRCRMQQNACLSCLPVNHAVSV